MATGGAPDLRSGEDAGLFLSADRIILKTGVFHGNENAAKVLSFGISDPPQRQDVILRVSAGADTPATAWRLFDVGPSKIDDPMMGGTTRLQAEVNEMVFRADRIEPMAGAPS